LLLPRPLSRDLEPEESGSTPELRADRCGIHRRTESSQRYRLVVIPAARMTKERAARLCLKRQVHNTDASVGLVRESYFLAFAFLLLIAGANYGQNALAVGRTIISLTSTSSG
jgi:hypothetical protein